MSDFAGLAAHLLQNINRILPEILPGGKIIGHEYCLGNLRGDPGDSCKVNIHTGVWCDFANENDKGGDLISLYAAIFGKSQIEAYNELFKKYNFNETSTEFRHYKHGNPTTVWPYHDADGRVIFHIARYDPPSGKQFCPWVNGKAEAYPKPRPLFNLHKITAEPSKPILICEGEKSALAAEILTENKYVCTTWPNGARAFRQADWSPLEKRNILIFPDADAPGIAAADGISAILRPKCPDIKIINVDGQPDGFDAADAVLAGWTWPTFKAWAQPRALNITVNTIEDQGKLPQSIYAIHDLCNISTSSNGQPIINIDNAAKLIENLPDLKGLVWLDKFYQRIFTKWKTNDSRPWTDTDTTNICRIVQRDYGLLRMSKECVFDAVVHVASNNERNEPRDWMDSLIWDETERVQTFFTKYMGVEDTEYTRAAAKNWWISIAARTYWPGCQMDNMVVLKGKQGVKKSSSLRVIGGKWYAAAGDNILHKDFYEILQGKLIVEIAELAGFHKQEIETIKRVVSNPMDRFRVSYGRIAEDHPRQCVFVATTNEENPLRDHTGGRRFWPVSVNAIDVDAIAHDRAQLFAESVKLYKKNNTWYEMPATETERVQEENRQDDEWESILNDLLSGKNETTVKDAARLLSVGVDKLGKAEQMRIGRCLTVLGWKRKTAYRGGMVLKLWTRETLPPIMEWSE